MRRTLFVLLGALTLSSGCTYRYVYSVEDTPVTTDAGRPSTIVNTIETTWYAFIPLSKDVYYECRNDGGSLDCVRLCDVKNEDGDKIRCRFVGL
jgi:hypothetical protein